MQGLGPLRELEAQLGPAEARFSGRQNDTAGTQDTPTSVISLRANATPSPSGASLPTSQRTVGAVRSAQVEADALQRVAQQVAWVAVARGQLDVVRGGQLQRGDARGLQRCGAAIVRKSCTLRMAEVSAGGASVHPTRHPVTA